MCERKQCDERLARRDGVRVMVLVCLAAFGSAGFSQTGAPSAVDVEFFEREVRPVLAEQCYSCHSAKIETPFAGLRVDSREALLKGGESGAAILPGDPENSRLIKLLRGEPLLMPPTGPLVGGPHRRAGQVDQDGRALARRRAGAGAPSRRL